MADLYLDAVRAIRPSGPWHLGGWSFGGLVAYEMACRLREPAGLVAILDMPPRGEEGELDDETELLVRGLDEQLLKTVPLCADELRGLGTREQVALVLAKARRAGTLPPDFDERRAAALVEVFKANLRAARAWQPRPFPGRITVLRAAGGHLDGDGGWGSLAAGVDVVTVPGNHHSMVTPPHVETLARALSEALERVER
jgi:thioesterase domain-containing protein